MARMIGWFVLVWTCYAVQRYGMRNPVTGRPTAMFTGPTMGTDLAVIGWLAIPLVFRPRCASAQEGSNTR